MEKSLLIHPSEILTEEFLKPLRVTPSELARSIRVDESRVFDLINKRTPISAELDKSFATFFGTSVGFWLSLQQKYELDLREF